MQNETVNPNPGFVYMQTNESERNRLLVFKRASDGTLTPGGASETGGAGDGHPHLTSGGDQDTGKTGNGMILVR
jgi:hypothetical protein